MARIFNMIKLAIVLVVFSESMHVIVILQLWDTPIISICARKNKQLNKHEQSSKHIWSITAWQ